MRVQRLLVAFLGLVSLGAVSCSDRPEVNGLVAATIDGQVVVTGPVAGALVSAYTLDLETGRQGALLGTSALSDAAGHYHIDLGNAPQGPVLLVAKGVGGSYTEPASGVTVHWDASTQLRAVFVEWAPTGDLSLNFAQGGKANLIISPISEWAMAYAPLRLASRRDSTYADALKGAIARWRDHLELDYWSVAPQDFTQGAVGAWSDAVQAGLFYAALSQLTLSFAQQSSISPAGLSSLSLVAAIRDDLSDNAAQLDGVGPSGQLTVGTCSGSCRLSEATLRARLAEAGANFLGGSANKSAITVTDAQAYLTRITARLGDLWAGGGNGTFDTTPPTITVDGLQDAAILHDTVIAKVTVFDSLEMADATVAFSRAGAPVTGFYTATPSKPNAQTVVIDLSLVTTSTGDGPIVLTITAKDKAGNAATPKVLSLFVNNLGPGAIAGVVLVSGRVQGARVQAWVYDGGIKGQKLGEATADAAGVYSLDIQTGTTTSTILLEAGNPATGAAAQYIEPANGYTVVFSSGDIMSSIVTNWRSGDKRSDGMISPWTTMGTSLAHGLYVSPLYNADGSKWTTAVEDGFTLLEDHFAEAGNRVALRAVQPADLTAPGTSTFNAQARYGFILCALSEVADHHAAASSTTAATLNSLTLTKLLAQDLGQDGVGAAPLFNGHTAAGILVSGRVNLTSYVTRVDLAVAGADFLTNPRNKAPFLELDVDPLLDRMAGDSGRLYPASEAPIPYDKVPPSPVVFTVNTAAAGTVLRGAVALEATASDNRALATFAWEATSSTPLNAITGSHLDKGSSLAGPWLLTGTLNTDALVEGSITVSAVAYDEAQNVTHTAPRTFVVDRTKPVFAFTSAMVGTTSLASGGWTAGASITVKGTLTEAHLQTATYTWAGGAAQPLTIAGDGSWTLTALSMPASGNYVLALSATDQAGNTSDSWSVNFNRDADPPAILLLPHAVPSGTDIIAHVDGAAPGVAVYDFPVSNMQQTSGFPAAGKVVTRWPALWAPTATNLPDIWWNVTDNHSAAASITLTGRLWRVNASGTNILLKDWFTITGASGPGYNRSLVISSALSADVAAVGGRYLLDYQAVDELGNPTTMQTTEWQHAVRAPLLRQRAAAWSCDTNDIRCPLRYGLEGNNASQLLTGGGILPNKITVGGGLIDNPNPVAVRVRLHTVLAGTASRGLIWRNPVLDIRPSVLTTCDGTGRAPQTSAGQCFSPGSETVEDISANFSINGLMTSASEQVTGATPLGGEEYEIAAFSTATVTLLSEPWASVIGLTGTQDVATFGMAGPAQVNNMTGTYGVAWVYCYYDGLNQCSTQLDRQAFHALTRYKVSVAPSISLDARFLNPEVGYAPAEGSSVANFSYGGVVVNSAETGFGYF